MTEAERLHLAERIISLARQYVERDPHQPSGGMIQRRSTADFERQQALRAQLLPLFEEWDRTQENPSAPTAGEQEMIHMLTQSKFWGSDEPAERSRDPSLDRDLSRRDDPW